MRGKRNPMSQGAIYQLMLKLEDTQTASGGKHPKRGAKTMRLPALAVSTAERAGAICGIARLYGMGLVSADNMLKIVADIAKGD